MVQIEVRRTEEDQRKAKALEPEKREGGQMDEVGLNYQSGINMDRTVEKKDQF